MTFRLYRVGDHATQRCRCGTEFTYREPEPPTVRNARRSHVCVTGVRARMEEETR